MRRVGTNAQKASASARRDQIIIRIPVHWPREEGFKAFMDLKRKIAKKIAAKPEQFTPTPELAFTDGQELTLLGKTYRVRISESGNRNSTARMDGTEVTVRLADNLTSETKREHASNLVRRVLSQAMLPEVDRRVRELNAEHFGFSLRKVFLKGHTAKWGSCSERGNVNLNFKLLFAPPEVLDYVIIHELAHLKVKGHGGDFWELVAKACPDFEARKKWLKENGAGLGRPGLQENAAASGLTSPAPEEKDTQSHGRMP
ncbi:M48 family metallopeptidase [Candidatus Micrarchaeota archaeon]|nr:M48 family metallopeptidase [Candidatus Micrarchaeota archaeon]